MKIKVVKVGFLETNCYILNKDNNNLIIDPGSDYEKIIKEVDGNIIGILITHNHDDHIGALPYFKEVPIYNLDNLKEGLNKIDYFKFEVIKTKGHTNDSISFLFENILFSGDFIFKGTIGRTDLGGNNEDMKISIETILSYDDLIIYPGHGDKTTLNEERDMLEYYKENL